METLTKLDIRNLIGLADFTLEKGVVKPYEELKEEWQKDIYDHTPDEDLIDEVGKPCYYLIDNTRLGIRKVYLGEKCDSKMVFNIIDELDVYINDLVFEDVIERCKYNNDNKHTQALKYIDNQGSYEDLYNYIKDNNLLPMTDEDVRWLEAITFLKHDMIQVIED